MIELTTAGFSSPILEICSYFKYIEVFNKMEQMFSSPIFGDMFLLLFDQLVDISTIIDIFNGTLNGQ